MRTLGGDLENFDLDQARRTLGTHNHFDHIQSVRAHRTSHSPVRFRRKGSQYAPPNIHAAFQRTAWKGAWRKALPHCGGEFKAAATSGLAADDGSRPSA